MFVILHVFSCFPPGQTFPKKGQRVVVHYVGEWRKLELVAGLEPSWRAGGGVVLKVDGAVMFETCCRC